MAKHKHYSKTEKAHEETRRVKEVIIRQRSGSDYYDEGKEPEIGPERINVYSDEDADYDDFDGNYGRRRFISREQQRKRKRRNILLVLLILAIITVVSLVVTNGRTFVIIGERFKVALMGSGVGDGFPVSVVGNNITQKGFVSTNYGCVTLSDTALSAVNHTGKTIFTVRHSYASPMLSQRDGEFILFDCGSYGYCTVDSSGNVSKHNSDYKLLAADIAENGSYAIVSMPEDYASQVEVFDKDGNLKYTYKFSEDYACSVAMNPEGDKLAMSLLYTKNAEIYSKLVILSTKSENAVAEYIYKGCFVSEIYWNDSGAYCIGDEGVVIADGAGNFYEHSYAGKGLTAVYADDSKCYISLSSYSHSGDSYLEVFTGLSEPFEIHLDSRISGITSYGSAVTVLTGELISSFNSSSGKLVAQVDAGYDTRAIAQADSSTVYVLGAEEIRSFLLVD